jgi:hypothetical protein
MYIVIVLSKIRQSKILTDSLNCLVKLLYSGESCFGTTAVKLPFSITTRTTAIVLPSKIYNQTIKHWSSNSAFVLYVYFCVQ